LVAQPLVQALVVALSFLRLLKIDATTVALVRRRHMDSVAQPLIHALVVELSLAWLLKIDVTKVQLAHGAARTAILATVVGGPKRTAAMTWTVTGEVALRCGYSALLSLMPLLLVSLCLVHLLILKPTMAVHGVANVTNTMTVVASSTIVGAMQLLKINARMAGPKCPG